MSTTAHHIRVNRLTVTEVRDAVNYMRTTYIRGTNKKYIEMKGWRGYRCNLSGTKKTKDGSYKYAQFDITRFGNSYGRRKAIRGKVLVHALLWRHANNFRKIPYSDLELSHIDSDPHYMKTMLETHADNESRKYCHLNGWWRPLPGETAPRCPHREFPCTGPGLSFNQWYDHRILK